MRRLARLNFCFGTGFLQGLGDRRYCGNLELKVFFFSVAARKFICRGIFDKVVIDGWIDVEVCKSDKHRS